jgi:nicotinamidase-related amidase
MESYSIDYANTALIVIDMLEGQVDSDSVIMNHYRNLEKDLPNWFLSQMNEIVEPNIKQLLSSFRSNDGMVIHARMCSSMKNYTDLPVPMQFGNMMYEKPMIAPPEAPESRFLESLRPTDDESIITKSACSAFEGTPLEKVLHRNGINCVVLVGVFTNMCISSTARSAFDKGFDVLVVSDACGDVTPYLHDSALASLGILFSNVCKLNQITNA